MNEEAQTNGRPRWTDVLRQQELSEARMSALLETVKQHISGDVASVKTEVEKLDIRLTSRLDSVEQKVDNLATQEAVRTGKYDDRMTMQRVLQQWGAVLIAGIAVAVAILK